MKFLSDILAKAGLITDGVVTLNNTANASVDTDRFVVLDNGTVKYRTGSQVLSDIGGVSTARTITINGVSYDLSTDRSWTISEADTLATVTTRGATTTNSITVGGLTVNGNIIGPVMGLYPGYYEFGSTNATPYSPIIMMKNGYTSVEWGWYAGDPTYTGVLLYRQAPTLAEAAYWDLDRHVLPSAARLLWGTPTALDLTAGYDLGLSREAAGILQVNNGAVNSYATIKAASFVRNGGTSSQFLKADGSVDSNTYLTSVSSGTVTTALGYTPVTNARTITINGTAFDLSANRSWTVGDVVTSGSYANPSWITSLAWSKITGAPSFLTSESDTLATVTARGASTSVAITVENTIVATGRVTAGNGMLLGELQGSNYLIETVSGTGIYLRPGGGTASTSVFITASGQLGVGVSSPTPGFKADINGALYVNGDIRSQGIYRDYQGEALLQTVGSVIILGSSGAATLRTVQVYSGNALTAEFGTNRSVYFYGSGLSTDFRLVRAADNSVYLSINAPGGGPNGSTFGINGTNILTLLVNGQVTVHGNAGLLVGANGRTIVRQSITGDAEIGAAAGGYLSLLSNGSEFARLVSTGQLRLLNYTSVSAFPGTAVATLGVDSSGNIITIAGGGAGSDTLATVTGRGNTTSNRIILTGSADSDNYAGALRIAANSSTHWGYIGLPDSVGGTTESNNYWLIGRGSTPASRVMSIHIPTLANYGSGIIPSFGVFTTGSIQLFRVFADRSSIFNGNVTIQGAQGFDATNETASLYLGDTASEIRATFDVGMGFYQNSTLRMTIVGGSGIVRIASDTLELSGGSFRWRHAGSWVYAGNSSGDYGGSMGVAAQQFWSQGDYYFGTRGVWLSNYLNQAVLTSSAPTFAGLTVSGVLYSTYNTASGRPHLSFSTGTGVLGNIHIQNGAGPSGSGNQAAITFMGGTATQAQAGIYVLNDNSSGTSMGFATTDSYAVGPQIYMTASNSGVVNFVRSRPTAFGNVILDAGNFGSYALPLSGGTMTGKIFGPSMGSDTYGGLIEIRERGYVSNTQSDWSFSPALTFHWGNRAAIRFGLRSDGLMAVDGNPIVIQNSGTWNISVSGNAATATNATNATTATQSNMLWDAYRTGYRWSNDLHVLYAYGAGNADTVDGYHLNQAVLTSSSPTFAGLVIGGTTINGTSYFQWEGATFRNPGTYTSPVIIRADNSNTGINGSFPALTLYNNNGADQTTVSLNFASAEGATGAGNSVALAGIIAKKEAPGNVGGWSPGSLTFYVKNFGTRVDAQYIGSDGRVGFGTTDFSFTSSDNASLINTISNNRIFVNGSIQLLGNQDAIVFGRGAASFIRDEEIGFGWGGGWFMTDSTFLRVRNGASVQLYTPGIMRADGDMRAPIFYDQADTSYYLDPNSYSRIWRTATHIAPAPGVGSGNWVADFQNTATSSLSFGGDLSTGGPSGTWWFQMNMRHSNSSSFWGTQLAFGWEDNANRLLQRNVTGNNFSGWVEYANTGNFARLSLMYYEGFTLDANTMSSNSTGFTYSVNAPYTGPIIHVGASGYGLQFNANYGDGSLLAYRVRNGDNGTWQAWRRIVFNSGTWDISITGNSGYSSNSGALNGWGFTSYAYRNGGSGYYQINDWLQMNGAHGVYWPSYYNFHIRPNISATYCQMEIIGSKNSYGGIWDNYSAVNVAMYDSAGNGGVYREANGRWYWYYHVGNASMGVNGSTTSSSYALYVNGAIYATSDICAYSDRRKKTNIVTIENALDKVSKMRGVFYDKIGEEHTGRQLGVIAQEVEEVLPEAVSYAADIDEYGVKYGNMVGLLLEAIKEQQGQIEDLKKQIEYLVENR